MLFAYGQINKKWYFVRKFGLNCLSSTVFKNAEQKQSVIMPFKYTDEKENFLYAWRAFSYGKKIEIFC